MDKFLQYSAAGVISLAVIAALVLHSWFFPPTWLDRNESLNKNWKKLDLWSGLMSCVMSLSAFLLYHQSYGGEYSLLAALNAGVLTFVTVQSFATDTTMRLVNRWMLRLASLLVVVPGTWFLCMYQGREMILIYALMAVFFGMLVFLPFVGESDARAMLLVSISTIPVIGLHLFSWGIALVGVAVVIYGLVRTIKERAGVKAFFTKISIPMVPLIVSPFLVMIFVSVLI